MELLASALTRIQTPFVSDGANPTEGGCSLQGLNNSTGTTTEFKILGPVIPGIDDQTFFRDSLRVQATTDPSFLSVALSRIFDTSNTADVTAFDRGKRGVTEKDAKVVYGTNPWRLQVVYGAGRESRGKVLIVPDPVKEVPIPYPKEIRQQLETAHRKIVQATSWAVDFATQIINSNPCLPSAEKDLQRQVLEPLLSRLKF